MKMKNIIINGFKTMSEYDQPDFYHFNEDSIKLVKFIISKLSLTESIEIVDMYSGCGIVGYELASKTSLIHKITFIEIQKEFIPFIKENNKVNCDITIINSDLKDVDFSDYKKSLFIANPPYYNKKNFRQSPNPNKTICRSMDNEDFTHLVKLMNDIDARGMKCFILGLKQEKHFLNLNANFSSYSLSQDVCIYHNTI